MPRGRSHCSATNRVRSAELTGVGESVKVRQEGKANHYFHREPCGRTREGAVEASAAARVVGMIEQRKRYGPECRGFLIGRRRYLQNRHGEGLPGSALSEESTDARTPLAGTREGFDSPRQSCRGRGRKEEIRIDDERVEAIGFGHSVCWAAPRSGGLESHWCSGKERHIQRWG